MGMRSPQYVKGFRPVLSKERCTLAIILRRRLSFCKCQVSFGDMDALDYAGGGQRWNLKLLFKLLPVFRDLWVGSWSVPHSTIWSTGQF